MENGMTARAQIEPTPISALPGKSGLEYLQLIVNGKIANPPIAQLMNFRAAEVEHGRIVFAGVPTVDVYNLIDTVHGGFAAAMLDSAVACAILSTLDAETSFTTLEIKINYSRAMTADTGEVRAEGKVIQVGRRVGTAEGRLTDSDGKLLAFATTTCLIVPRTPAR
jgi:uncharacterized protein (TIGR00369 family)